jgi:hypothetical protein
MKFIHDSKSFMSPEELPAFMKMNLWRMFTKQLAVLISPLLFHEPISVSISQLIIAEQN